MAIGEPFQNRLSPDLQGGLIATLKRTKYPKIGLLSMSPMIVCEHIHSFNNKTGVYSLNLICFNPRQ
jgi:hypothetical protein